MRLLDRNGWKTDTTPVVALDELEPALAARAPGARLGVRVPNNIHPDALAPVQGRLDLIAVDFPKFGDGRGFSLGRMLRQKGFQGRLRASGHILPDQFGFALQSGYDEVEIGDDQAARQPIDQWLRAPGLIGESYQESSDQRPSIFVKRRAAR